MLANTDVLHHIFLFTSTNIFFSTIVQRERDVVSVYVTRGSSKASSWDLPYETIFIYMVFLSISSQNESCCFMSSQKHFCFYDNTSNSKLWNKSCFECMECFK